MLNTLEYQPTCWEDFPSRKASVKILKKIKTVHKLLRKKTKFGEVLNRDISRQKIFRWTNRP